MDKYPVKIMAVGDICPGDHYFTMGHGVRSSFEKSPESFFGNLQDLLKSADISFCNLEGVLSDAGLDESSFKSFAFRGSPRMAKPLSSAGFNVANIANNHILQHGIAAFDETISRLRESGIHPLGIKAGPEYSSEPVLMNINGARVGLLGYSMVPERYCPQNIRYALSSPQEMKKDVSLLRQSADIIIVSCHCGIEAMDRPSQATRELARSLIDAGVDLFIGHHPHVFQPVELYKNGAILYSLGNFISDFFWGSSFVNTGIAEVKLGKGPAEVKIHRARTNKSCQPEMAPDAEINCVIEKACETVPDGDVELANLSYYSEAYRSMKDTNSKKNIFFLKHLACGRSTLKLGFLLSKLRRR